MDTPIRQSIPEREAYGVKETAVLLGGVTMRYVWTLIANGELKSFKMGGRRLIAREDIKEFIDSLRADEQRARAEATK